MPILSRCSQNHVACVHYDMNLPRRDLIIIVVIAMWRIRTLAELLQARRSFQCCTVLALFHRWPRIQMLTCAERECLKQFALICCLLCGLGQGRIHFRGLWTFASMRLLVASIGVSPCVALGVAARLCRFRAPRREAARAMIRKQWFH